MTLTVHISNDSIYSIHSIYITYIYNTQNIHQFLPSPLLNA